MNCPIDELGRNICMKFLHDRWSDACDDVGYGTTQVDVSLVPPFPLTPDVLCCSCPHGRIFFVSSNGQLVDSN